MIRGAGSSVSARSVRMTRMPATLAFFQNLFRGPDLLIVVILFVVLFILFRRSDDKPKQD